MNILYRAEFFHTLFFKENVGRDKGTSFNARKFEN